jgi:hypothetical protein
MRASGGDMLLLLGLDRGNALIGAHDYVASVLNAFECDGCAAERCCEPGWRWYCVSSLPRRGLCVIQLRESKLADRQ